MTFGVALLPCFNYFR